MDKSSALPGNSLVDGRGNVKKGKIAELMMNNVKNKGKIIRKYTFGIEERT